MKIVVIVLVCNCILGAVMALYLAVAWKKYKRTISEHGWSPECADPICNNMWLICFIPVIGIIYYLVAGEAIGRLATTYKEDVNGTVIISYGKLSFNYQEEI